METEVIWAVFCGFTQVYKSAVTDYTLSVSIRRDPPEEKMAKNKNRKHAPQTQQAVNKSNEAEAAVKAPAAEAEPAAAAAEEITEQQAAPEVIEAPAEENQPDEVQPKEEAQSEPAQTKAKKQNQNKSKSKSNEKKRDAVYQIKTKRTSGILKAYITFTYRILHPKVTPRLILYGLVVAAPGVFFFKDIFWKVFFIAIGIALILLGFFRQYISLAITKKNDPDYINKSDFTYDFFDLSIAISKNGELISRITNYKDITAFYYDDAYYYLALAKEVHVLPKNAFTVGEPADFEEFIYKKSKKVCRWLPNKLSDRIKKRRAARAAASEDMFKK